MDKYNEKQLKEISLGKERGLDTSIYENPEFDSFQMREIRVGLLLGVDVSQYLNPEISARDMCRIKNIMDYGFNPDIPLKEQIKYGYKACNRNLTCRGVQFKEGEITESTRSPKLFNNGFHFCLDIIECFRFYSMGGCLVYKVEILGEVDGIADSSICCTNKIKFLEKVYDGEHSEDFWSHK